jgi:hypothetical protein
MENLKELLRFIGSMIYFLIVSIPLALFVFVFVMTAYEVKDKITQWQR